MSIIIGHESLEYLHGGEPILQVLLVMQMAMIADRIFELLYPQLSLLCSPVLVLEAV